jgi:caa(3)-type oxidase subunit IV
MAESHHPNYRKIYITLLVLLVISVAGPFLGIKWITLITAFGIALVKANLVVQNFMHLKWEKRIMKWTLATSLVLMLMLFFAVAPDVMRHDGRNWVNDAALASTARGIEPPHGEAPGGGHEAAPGQAEAPAAPAPPGFDARGAYVAVCSSCHGMSGAGDGPASSALNPQPAHFSDPAFWASRTDAQLVRAIREGGAAVGKSPSMPPWGSLYNEEQARAIVEYLKTLRR